MKWMVLGASPSAADYHGIKVDVVIGAGASIKLREPDYYMIVEEQALFFYYQQVLIARACGMKVVITETMQACTIGRMYLRDISYPHDIVIDAVQNAPDPWVPGDIHFTAGGGVALQFALVNGATEIHMVGMEGYLAGGKDYFTGESSTEDQEIHSHTVYEPLLRRIVEQSPDVEFVTYGKLNYPLVGDNVRDWQCR